MPRHLERYKKTERAETNIQISNEREIGYGGFADVFLVDVTVQVGSKNRTAPFVLKRYKDSRFFNRTKRAEALSEDAKNAYDALKAAGLKVWNTFRVLPGEGSILMSTGHTDETVCVGTNTESSRVSDFPELGIEFLNSEVDILQLFEELNQQSDLATAAGILLSNDVIFFLVNKADTTQIDFVLGDYDYVGLNQGAGSMDLKQQNRKHIYDSLKFFIKLNFSSLDAENFLAELQAIYPTQG